MRNSQDNNYWRAEPATLVSCWIALDDATLDNGALHMVPGSHKHAHPVPPPQGHAADGGAYFREQLEDLYDISTAEVLEMKAGSAVFHHCQ